MKKDFYFIFSGDGRGGVDPKTTHLFSQKYDFITYRKDEGFSTYKVHCKRSPVVSSFSSIYSDNATGDSFFGISSGDGKGDVIPITTHI